MSATRMRANLTLDGVPAFPRLVVQVWSEIPRDAEPAAILAEGCGSIRVAWSRVIEGYQEAGMMRGDVLPDHVARMLIAAVLGVLAQQSLFGPAPAEILRDGPRALISMGDPAHRN